MADADEVVRRMIKHHVLAPIRNNSQGNFNDKMRQRAHVEPRAVLPTLERSRWMPYSGGGCKGSCRADGLYEDKRVMPPR